MVVVFVDRAVYTKSVNVSCRTMTPPGLRSTKRHRHRLRREDGRVRRADRWSTRGTSDPDALFQELGFQGYLQPLGSHEKGPPREEKGVFLF